MYYSNISEVQSDGFSEKFKACFAFMEKEYKSATPGATDLELGNAIVAHFQEYTTITENEIQYEAHQKFYDIQFVLEGNEILSVYNTAALIAVGQYDVQNDITFYDEPVGKASQIVLHPGDFAILGATDAHKPKLQLNGAEKVKKIVIKVPMT